MSSKPKRILLLTTQLGYGGAERSLILLANDLSQYMQVSVAVFTQQAESYTNVEGGPGLACPLIELDDTVPHSKWKRWLLRWWRLRQLKRQNDLCISFLNGPNLLNVLSGERAHSVVSIRGSMLHDANMRQHHPFLNRRLLLPFTLRRAGHVVVISNGLRHEVRQLGGNSAASKTRVIPPFLREEEMRSASNMPVPASFATLAKCPLIVTVSRLSVEKNIQQLIDVFAQIAARITGAKLLIVGSGPMEQALKERCISHGIPIDVFTPEVASVIFAGHQPNPLAFMAMAKVFAFPSNAEGFGNAMLEALFAEVLVVATDAPWGARMLLCNVPDDTSNAYPTHMPTPANYGILMPRIDEQAYQPIWVNMLCDCLSHDNWQHRYRPHARSRAMMFEQSQIAPKWHAFIKEMCGND